MEYNNSKAERRRRKRRRKILQKVIPFGVAVILIAVVVIVSIKSGLFEDWGYSSKKADLNSYFKCISDETASVIKDNEVTDEKLVVKDGHLYLDLEQIDENYNNNFYYEDVSGRLLYTTGDGVYSAVPGEMLYKLGDKATQTGYTVCYQEGDNLMIALEYVKLFTDFEIKLFGGSGEPYRCEIKTEWGSDMAADVIKEETAIRDEADKEGDILKEVKAGDTVKIIASENENWMKVMSEDFIAGYIEKKHLGDSYERSETPVTGAIGINVAGVADYSKPIVLAWHNVTNENSVSYLDDYSKYLGSINTISPTWFALADDEGTIASIASSEYVTKCHEKGIKVWGLVDNMTYPDVSTYTVMSDPDKRASVINQLLSFASEYGLDGINVDFENVTKDAGPHFVQFVRELCLAAHKQNLVISVDNYVPQNYTLHYDRKTQGMFADYVIIMGYDEHTSGSEEAGSVASLDFVLNGIEETLKDVPANKVVNALPFYTRLWSVDSNGAITEMQTIPMEKGIQSVNAAGATAAWDDASGQNYAEWTDGSVTNKIWLEDTDSLGAKLDVMTSHNIGGAAVWQLAFSTEEAWSVINEHYNP